MFCEMCRGRGGGGDCIELIEQQTEVDGLGECCRVLRLIRDPDGQNDCSCGAVLNQTSAYGIWRGRASVPARMNARSVLHRRGSSSHKSSQAYECGRID